MGNANEEDINKYIKVPLDVVSDPNLRPNSKLLYGIINGLTNNESNCCWATNTYFKEQLKCSERAVQKLLTNLEDFNYISRDLIYKADNSAEVDKRLITINKTNRGVLRSESKGDIKNYIPHEQKFTTPMNKNSPPTSEQKFTTPSSKKIEPCQIKNDKGSELEKASKLGGCKSFYDEVEANNYGVKEFSPPPEQKFTTPMNKNSPPSRTKIHEPGEQKFVENINNINSLNINSNRDRDRDISLFDSFYISDDQIRTAFMRYIKARAEVGKPLSQDAIVAQYETLMDLSHGNKTKALKIIKQSIEHNWNGFFELKQTTKPKAIELHGPEPLVVGELPTRTRIEVRNNGESK